MSTPQLPGSEIEKPVLEVASIGGGYGDIEVVHDVSLTVKAGQITALLGRNGAGKTTLLRLVAGISTRRRGQVLLEGHDICDMRAHRRVATGIGFVQEGKRIFRQRSIEDNIILGSYSRNLSRAERQEVVAEAFDRFPALAAKKGTTAGALSGGQQQMLAIAQTLAGKPKVLMLDEPSTGLAPSIVAEVVDLVNSLRAEGLAVLLVEQAVDFCLRIADEIVVMNLGRVVLNDHADAPELRHSIERAYLSGQGR